MKKLLGWMAILAIIIGLTTYQALPKVFTTIKEGSDKNSGSDIIKFFPLPTTSNSKTSK